jgi:O-antigen/teichoic acid export membrane protein
MSKPPRPNPPLSARHGALLEQGLLSVAQLLAFLLWARLLAPEAWGQFGLAYAGVLFLQGFQRAWVTLPMVPLSARGAGWARTRLRWARLNMGLALLVAVALGLATLAGTRLLADSPWLASLGMAAALWLPMSLHEFARRAAAQEARWGLLAAMGAAHAAVLLAAASLPWWALAGTPAAAWWPAAALCAASVSAAAVYRWGSGQRLLPCPGGWPQQARYREFAGWAGASHLAYSGYNFGVQALLAAVAGPAAVGAFHAARMLVQPLGTLMAALDSVDKPRAALALAASGMAGLQRVRRRSIALLLGFGLPYLAGVALAAPWLLDALFGPAYAGHTGVVVLWCTVMASMAVSQPVETSLYVAERTRELFQGRAAAGALALALAGPLSHWQGAAGALAAMALGYAFTAVWGLRVLGRDGPAGAHDPAAPPSAIYLAWTAFQRRQVSMAPLAGFDCIFMPLGYKGRSHLWRGAHYALLMLRSGWLLWRRRPTEVWLQLPQLPLLWPALLHRQLIDRRMRVVADCHNAVFRPPWSRVPLGLGLLRHCDLILVHNTDMLAAARAAGLPAERLRVLEDVPPTRPTDAPPPVPAAFAGRPRPWVLFAGSYGADEPIAELMLAARRLPGGTLAVTGRITNIAKNGHVIDYVPLKVRQTGYVPTAEFEALLRHADVVLALTRLDGIQLSVCGEALGYGKPMVMSGTPLLRRLFGSAAVVVDSSDPDDLAAGILAAWRAAAHWGAASSALAEWRRHHWQRHALAEAMRLLARPSPDAGPPPQQQNPESPRPCPTA